MGIRGLTHDENGTALEKLPVTIKVAIGEGPESSNGNSYPRKLDHFVFKRQKLRGQEVVWEPADIAQAHGDKPTSLRIIFLNDDPREVLRTEYALWTPSGCNCHGEFVQIANGEGVRLPIDTPVLREAKVERAALPPLVNHDLVTWPVKCFTSTSTSGVQGPRTPHTLREESKSTGSWRLSSTIW